MWVQGPAAQHCLRATGFHLRADYRVKDASEWRVELVDPAGGHVPTCTPPGWELWEHAGPGERGPEHLEELIENVVADVRRRTMAKRAALQRLFEKSEADDEAQRVAERMPLPAAQVHYIPGLGPAASPLVPPPNATCPTNLPTLSLPHPRELSPNTAEPNAKRPRSDSPEWTDAADSVQGSEQVVYSSDLPLGPSAVVSQGSGT